MVKSRRVSNRSVLVGLFAASASLASACDVPEGADGATRSALSATRLIQRGAQFSSTPSLNGDLALAIDGPSALVAVYPNGDGHSSLLVDLNANRPTEIQPINLTSSNPVPLEWGDFNGDGRDELVVGLPSITVVGETAGEGGFALISFNADGSWASTAITRIASGWTTTTAVRWGTSLAVGDFDGNGYDDLAVGNGNQQVRIYRGSSTGLAYTYAMTYASTGHAFGWSLAACDFNCDGYEDLAAGVPGRDAGNVVIMNGSSGRLAQKATLRPPGLTGDEAGATISAANFNGDAVNGRPCIDLAVAIPNKTVSGVGYAGQVNVYLSQGTAGLSDAAYKELNQDVSGVRGAAESGDLFGNHVLGTDLNGDGEDELVVETYMDPDLTGSVCGGDKGVQIFLGSSSGVQTRSDRNFLFQGSGHEGVLGGTLGDKLADTSFHYSGASCPDTHVTLYNFGSGNYTQLPLSSTQSIYPAQLGLSSTAGVGAGLTHTHPGYIR